MPVDAVGLSGMKSQTRTFLTNIDLDDTSRKAHNRALFDLAKLFRATRTINHKKIVVN